MFGIFSTNPRFSKEPYYFSSDDFPSYAVYETQEEAQAICDVWNAQIKADRIKYPRAVGKDYPYVVKPWQGDKYPR